MLQSLEHVAEAVGKLADETRDLSLEVRTDNAERKRQSRQQMLLIVIALVVLALLVAVVVRQQVDLTSRSQAAAVQRQAQIEVANQINDCINPAGACYKRSQANQQAIISRIVQGEIAANRCGVQANGDVAKFDACLKAHGLAPTPPPPPSATPSPTPSPRATG
jgi:type II secretory pathway pseudopilin PulG